MGWGWDGVGWVVCEGWLVFSKATCFPENHMTNHCCLSSRYLLLKILAFLKNHFFVNADGVGVGMGWGALCVRGGLSFQRLPVFLKTT